jgi:hypothetical protein
MNTKHIPSFDEFVNEGVLDSLVNEGALAKKGASEFADINLADQIDMAEDREWEDLYKEIAKVLKETPANVIQIDSETNEDDPTSRKIYNYLNTNLNPTTPVETKAFPNAYGWQLMHDHKKNVVRMDDHGFVGFFFTAKSNF